MTEHVFLVAVTVTSRGDREEAELFLHEHMPEPYQGAPTRTYIEEWWIAEDDRRDGSDNDSAVFVHKGGQERAQRILRDSRR